MTRQLLDGNLWFFLLVLAALLLGLFGVIFLRCRRVPILGFPSEYLFFAAMGLIGLLTMLSAACGSGYWLGCGAALCMMVVGATLDPMPKKTITTWV